MDNFFTSVPLCEDLQRNGLTLVGTLRSNKAEIPAEFQKDKRRSVLSTVFGMTLCLHVPKKGKAVILLSSLHHDGEIVDDETRKPEIIMSYNMTKCVVDTLDQCVHAYSCSRTSNRWPNKVFFNILDVNTLNACRIFTQNNPEWNDGKLYKRRLSY